jgi:hypothetical protein
MVNLEEKTQKDEELKTIKDLIKHPGYKWLAGKLEEEVKKNDNLIKIPFEEYRRRRGIANLQSPKGDYLTSIAVPITLEEFNNFRESHITAVNVLEYVLGLPEKEIQKYKEIKETKIKKEKELEEAQKRKDFLNGKKD